MSSSQACRKDGTRWLRWPAVALAAALVAVMALGSGGISAADNVHAAVYAWARVNPGQDVPLLVQTDGDTGAVADFIRSSGGNVQRQFQIIPAVEADVSPALVSSLASHSNVAWISLDAPVVYADEGDAVDTRNLATAYPFAVNAPDVWDGVTSSTGREVTVAILDTGITNDNKDFKEGKRSRVLFDVAVNPLAADFDDGYGHGTHVAGIVGGDGDLLKQKKYVGIAPDANFVDVKTADDDGNASLADVIAGLEWVYDNKDAFDIRVVNLSLTSSVAQSYKVDPLDAAVEFLWFNDIVVVVAAGNLGDAPDAVHYPPANDPFVIVTGAFDDMGTADGADDALTTWSSRGITQDGFAKPDLVAPGRRIVSDIDTDSFLAQTYRDRIVDGKYFRMSGTSMAAPVVSGVVALMLEEHPELTPGEVKHVLQSSSRSVDGSRAPLADEAVSFSGTPGNTDDGLTPNFLLSHAPVVQVGAVAYVLGEPNSNAVAAEVGLDLGAAGIQGASLDSVDWGAIKWSAIKWSAIKWSAIKWDAIKWDAIRWDAIKWDAIKWSADVNFDAIKWSAIKWSAIKWSAIKWSAIKWSASAVSFDAIKWSAIKWSAFPE